MPCGVALRALALRDLHHVLAASLKHREQVGDPEHFPHLFIQVDQPEFAARRFGRNVLADNRPESGAIYIRQATEVENDTRAPSCQILYFALQLRRSIDTESAALLQNGTDFCR